MRKTWVLLLLGLGLLPSHVLALAEHSEMSLAAP